MKLETMTEMVAKLTNSELHTLLRVAGNELKRSEQAIREGFEE